jgi:hypothetical protein
MQRIFRAPKTVFKSLIKHHDIEQGLWPIGCHVPIHLDVDPLVGVRRAARQSYSLLAQADRCECVICGYTRLDYSTLGGAPAEAESLREMSVIRAA